MSALHQPDVEPDEVDEAILGAAQVVMAARSESGLPLKALLMYEYMDESGERILSWRSTHMLTWDRIGFAQTILLGEAAQYNKAYGDGEMD